MRLSLSNLKIIYRLNLLIAVTALGIACLAFVCSDQIRTSLLRERVEQTRRLVEVAHSIATNYEGKVKSGEYSAVGAQKAALEAISAMRYDGDQYFWVNNWDGVMLAHGADKSLVKRNVIDKTDPNGKRVYADLIEIAKSTDGASYDYLWPDAEGKERAKLSYIKGVKSWRWAIGSGIFLDDVNAAIRRVQAEIVGASLAVLLLASLLAFLIGRSISRPLLAVDRAMRELAAGNLSVELGMANRRDEIGEMARAFDELRSGLTRARELEAERAADTATKAERAEAVAGLARKFEGVIGGVVDALSNSADKLQTDAASMSSASEQTRRQSAVVATAAEDASVNVEAAAGATEEMSVSSREIGEQVTRASTMAGAAVDEAARAGVEVDGLARAARQIGDVVSLIQEIAGQTNLLALNATIEAARAGEAGKGFAVVASEVKALAGQTAKATEEISAHINGIQTATGSTVAAIKSIGASIGSISEVATAVAAAVQEQIAANEEISSNVGRAAQRTRDISGNIAGVATAAERTGTVAETVLSAANQLTTEADGLRREVETFLGELARA